MGITLLHRREGIIVSTIEVLNEVGLQNLSTKLIAKREGISEGTLFRHFKNKTEIMLAVLEHFSQFDDAIIETNRNKKLNAIDTIRNFMNAYAEYYENYRAITALVQVYDSLMAEPELNEKIRMIISTRSNFILETIKRGKEEGLIKSDVDCKCVEDLITGGNINVCLKWRMNKYSFSLKERTLAMLNTILELIITKE